MGESVTLIRGSGPTVREGSSSRHMEPSLTVGLLPVSPMTLCPRITPLAFYLSIALTYIPY
jgi:hypothetical protein